MGGRLLAIDEGHGYRPILSAKAVHFLHQQDARPPSTIVYGNQLFAPRELPTLYYKFFEDKFGTTLKWAQCRIASQDTVDELYRIAPLLAVVLVCEQELTLVAAGVDSIRGDWVQFAGGPIHLFSQPDWWNESEDIRC